MAGFFFGDHGANTFLDVEVGGAVPEQDTEVVVILAEEAGANFSVGGQADAGTVAAEGLSELPPVRLSCEMVILVTSDTTCTP